MKTNKNISKDQRGITHHLMLVGLAVIVAGAIGFAGFRIYKNNSNTKAAAYSWTNLSPSSSVKVYACQTLTRSGSVIRAYAKNIGASTATWSAFVPYTDVYLSGQVSAGVTTNVHYKNIGATKRLPMGATVNNVTVNNGVTVSRC